MSTVTELTAGPLRTYALEVHAVQHCNLRCVGCAQSSPYLPAGEEDLDLLEHSLRNLRSLLACEKVQVLGGEPLLHSALLDLLRLVVQSGIGKQVVVKTNGLLLQKAPSDFWRLTDTVIVSVYPATDGFLTPKRELLEATASRHGTKLIFRPIKLFQEIHRDHGPVNPEVTSAIYEACEYKQYCHSLKAGRVFRCAPSVNLAARTKVSHQDDSVDVLDPRDLPKRLRSFLTSPIPLHCCSGCQGASGAVFSHAMMHSAAR